MNLDEWMKRKDIKPKDKTEAITSALLSGEFTIIDIIHFATAANESAKATCMEAFEYATNQNPAIANLELFRFAQDHLRAKASRLRWESAKVIGNIAHLYSEDLESSIDSLLKNAKDDGTVVRWSAAYVLTRIYGLAQYSNDVFRGKLLNICESEEKDSIKKMYLKVI